MAGTHGRGGGGEQVILAPNMDGPGGLSVA